MYDRYELVLRVLIISVFQRIFKIININEKGVKIQEKYLFITLYMKYMSILINSDEINENYMKISL